MVRFKLANREKQVLFFVAAILGVLIKNDNESSYRVSFKIVLLGSMPISLLVLRSVTSPAGHLIAND